MKMIRNLSQHNGPTKSLFLVSRRTVRAQIYIIIAFSFILLCFLNPCNTAVAPLCCQIRFSLFFSTSSSVCCLLGPCWGPGSSGRWRGGWGVCDRVSGHIVQPDHHLPGLDTAAARVRHGALLKGQTETRCFTHMVMYGHIVWHQWRGWREDVHWPQNLLSLLEPRLKASKIFSFFKMMFKENSLSWNTDCLSVFLRFYFFILLFICSA